MEDFEKLSTNVRNIYHEKDKDREVKRSHREYIDFPEEITIKSIIEAGVGYNPEDSFNPLEYQ